MPLVIGFRAATALGAAGFLTAGILRPAVDVMRFHRIGTDMATAMEALALLGILFGVGGLLLAAMRAERRPSVGIVPPGRFWLAVALVTLVAGAIGVGLGLGLNAIHRGLAVEAALAFEMAAHGLLLVPGLFVAWLCLRGPSRAIPV